MANKIRCACGCNEEVTLATQRNHLDRRTGNHGLRARVAEDTQDLRHAFVEGLTRKRRQEEALRVHAPKRHRHRRREANDAGSTQVVNNYPSQSSQANQQQQARTAQLPPIETHGSNKIRHHRPLVDEHAPLDFLSQHGYLPSVADTQATIAEARVRSMAQLRWARWHHDEARIAEESLPYSEDEEDGEERGRALPGELEMADIPPLMEVSDDDDDDDDEAGNTTFDFNEDQWGDAGPAAADGQISGIDDDEQAANTFFREQFERDAARASTLDQYELSAIRPYTFKVEGHLTQAQYNQLPQVFPDAAVPTLKQAQKLVQSLSGLKSERYPSCINSCCCFVGPQYEGLEACPFCQEKVFKANGQPRKYFDYIPLIPRLKAQVANPKAQQTMLYRSQHTHNPGNITDVFDGQHYQSLLAKDIPHSNPPTKFFSDSRDIALGLSTDGFCPFKRRDKTCWPLILFNYNISPEDRFKKKNCINVGTVPGPRKPHDMDSFCYPLYVELIKLELGIEAYDGLREQLFMLRAFLILVFGDIPAISLMMRMKGHNGFRPCRMCNIRGIAGPNGKTHYVPLSRSCAVLQNQSDTLGPREYSAGSLPLRTHDEMMRQAQEVHDCATQTSATELSKQYGIKGITTLSRLSSVSFPASFPYDFMHLIWENTVKNLILFWTGKFKDIAHEGKGYRLAPHIWEQIGKDTAAAVATVPSSFGAPVPNLAQDGITMTAEMYSNWTLFIAPIVLKNRFPQPKYYDHFIKLVDTIKHCLSLEMTSETVAKIREGFRTWVEDYEKFYYEKKKARLSACPLTIHALLHIADGIEASGPVWAYWAYPMERHCNTLLPAIRSRRHPYASIATFVTAVAQLNQIRLIYDVEDDLNLHPKQLKQHLTIPGYEKFKLTSPRVRKELSAPHQALIWGHLGTRFGITAALARLLFPLTGVFWQHGRAVIQDEDIMHGRDLKETQEDTRDASYIRYDAEIDLDAHHVHQPERMAMRTFFGQLRRIVVIDLPTTPRVNLTVPMTVVLAIILQTPTDRAGDSTFTYRNATVEEIVDLDRVQCVVGRVFCREMWTYIDRSTQVNPPCI